MYKKGEGVTRNYTQAMYWLKKAAEQGSAPAQFNLALVQDDTQAIYWFEKAAEQGYAAAQVNSGMMYKKGLGIAQNYTQAIYWFTKAAEQGLASAQYNLALMYYDGLGVPQNYKVAYILFNVAEMNGSKKTGNRDIIFKKLSPTEVEDAQQMSTQLYNSKNFAVDLNKLLDSAK